MLRGVEAAALFCALLTLSGCQPPHEIYLINNTGRTIQVLHSEVRWQDHTGVTHTEAWRRFWNWPFLIDHGVGRRIPGAGWQVWIVDVRAARCRLRFEIPIAEFYQSDAGRDFARFHAHTTVQVESDERLYFVATQTADTDRPRAVDVTTFAAVQLEGLPVEPSSRVCPRR